MHKQKLKEGFPDGAVDVGPYLKILTLHGKVTYFVGGDNYIDHLVGDKRSERAAWCVLMANMGNKRMMQAPPGFHRCATEPPYNHLHDAHARLPCPATQKVADWHSNSARNPRGRPLLRG